MMEVVAALIRRGNTFLACQRPAHKARGLQWEFAGGKVEPGETKTQALARELREELGVELAVGEPVTEVTYRYPDVTVHLTLLSAAITAGDYLFRASGFHVTFDGFTALYEEATDEKEKKETSLPPLEQGQVLKLRELKSEQKFTQPPARYTEATLIKALEENGIGRPSTYAPIITTIIDRGYVERDQKKLKPTLLGRAVDGLMLEQFPHIVDVDFSAEMEKNLDKVESGKADWHKTVDDFYQGFAASLEQAEKNMEGKKVKVPDEPSSEVCDLCGRPMVIKVGKYGKFLACSGFPECRGTKRLVKDTGGICPKCGKGRMLERNSAKGRIYYGCERYPDCDFMTWDTPVPTKCEKCGSTLFRKGSKLYCAKEGCGFEMPVPKKE